MKTQIKTITPNWAAQILETRNPKNRSLNENIAKSFAVEMKAGRWAVTHQGIGFNSNGDLIDGQHRLRGIVIAGVPVDMMVTTGIPSSQRNGITYDTMDVVDRGRSRSIGQQLVLSHGWTCGTKVASMARAIAMLYSDSSQRVRITTPQTLAIINECEDSFRAIFEEANRVPGRSHAQIDSVVVIYHTINPVKALEFYVSFLDQTDWKQGTPARALEMFKQRAGHSFGTNQCIGIQATSAALMAHDAGVPVKILRLSQAPATWIRNINPKLRGQVRKILGEK